MDIQKVLKEVKKKSIIMLHFIRPSIDALFFSIIGPIAFRNQHVWLFSERGTDARDNGFHMYRYIREKHPDINAYYVISKDSPDKKNVEPYGNLIEYNSFRHRMIVYGAEYTVSSHLLSSVPDYEFIYFLRNRLHMKVLRSKEVFLQHGVTSNDLPQLYQENTQLALFICGAKPEYDYVRNHYHYHHNEVRYTGFARYDSLQNYSVKRQILIMPTWREWLTIGNKDPESTIRDSKYLQCWKAVLNDVRIKEFSSRYGVRFIFYPHYEIQKYIRLFGETNTCVTIADFAHYDVQTLLKESALLITDYSSVFFDFAYMAKPVIYYQFDEEDFRKYHYSEGYFDFKSDGFGEVVTTKDELVSQILTYLENHFAMKTVYAERIKKFFLLHDANNCDRIFQEIISLESGNTGKQN